MGRPAHQILNISPGATPEEAESAYRTMLQLYDPDRVADLADELRDLARRRTVEIELAYEAVKRGMPSVLIDAGPASTSKPTLDLRQADAGILPDDEMSGELYEQALDIIVDMGRASTSVLQRRLSIGYGLATRILDRLERDGFIAPSEGPAKPRKVLKAAYLWRERRHFNPPTGSDTL